MSSTRTLRRRNRLAITNDKFEHPSLDEVLCDPVKAAYFDRAARRFSLKRLSTVGPLYDYGRRAANW